MVDSDIVDRDITVKRPKILVFCNTKSDLHCPDNEKVEAVKESLEKDVSDLREWLDKKFEFESFKDCCKSRSYGRSKTFIDIVNDEDFKTSLKTCDSLIVFVLGIAGDSDMVCFEDATLSLDELIDPFRADKCPSLIGKPKIFVIHVYNGIEQDIKTQVGAERKVPSDADLFFSYTKMEHDYHGTTVMRCLTDMADLEGKEINDIFTAINGKIIVTEGFRCRSLYASTMTKCVYLCGPPRG